MKFEQIIDNERLFEIIKSTEKTGKKENKINSILDVNTTSWEFKKQLNKIKEIVNIQIVDYYLEHKQEFKGIPGQMYPNEDSVVSFINFFEKISINDEITRSQDETFFEIENKDFDKAISFVDNIIGDMSRVMYYENTKEHMKKYVKYESKIRELLSSSNAYDYLCSLIKNHQYKKMTMLLNMKIEKFEEIFSEIITGNNSKIEQCHCQVLALFNSNNESIKEVVTKMFEEDKMPIEFYDILYYIFYKDFGGVELEKNSRKYIKRLMIRAVQLKVYEQEEVLKEVEGFMYKEYYNETNFEFSLQTLIQGPKYYEEDSNYDKLKERNEPYQNSCLKGFLIYGSMKVWEKIKKDVNLGISTIPSLSEYDLEKIKSNKVLAEHYIEILNDCIDNKLYMEEGYFDILPFNRFSYYFKKYKTEIYGKDNPSIEEEVLKKQVFKVMIDVVNDSEQVINEYLNKNELKFFEKKILEELLPLEKVNEMDFANMASVQVNNLVSIYDVIPQKNGELQIEDVISISQKATKICTYLFGNPIDKMPKDKQKVLFLNELEKATTQRYDGNTRDLSIVCRKFFVIFFDDISKEQKEYVIDKLKKSLISKLLSEINFALNIDSLQEELFNGDTQIFTQHVKVFKYLQEDSKKWDFMLKEFFKDTYIDNKNNLYRFLKNSNLWSDAFAEKLLIDTIALKKQEYHISRVEVIKTMELSEAQNVVFKLLESKKEIVIINTLKMVSSYKGLDANKAIQKLSFTNREITNLQESILNDNGKEANNVINIYPIDNEFKNIKVEPMSEKQIDEYSNISEKQAKEFVEYCYDLLIKIQSDNSEIVPIEGNVYLWRLRSQIKEELEELESKVVKYVKSNYDSSIRAINLFKYLHKTKEYKKIEKKHKKKWFDSLLSVAFEGVLENLKLTTEEELKFFVSVIFYSDEYYKINYYFYYKVNIDAIASKKRLSPELMVFIKSLEEKEKFYGNLEKLYDFNILKYMEKTYKEGKWSLEDIVNYYNVNEKTCLLDFTANEYKDIKVDDIKDFMIDLQYETAKILIKDVGLKLLSSQRYTLSYRPSSFIGSKTLALLINSAELTKGLKNTPIMTAISNLKVVDETQEEFEKNIKPLKLSKIEYIDLAVNKPSLISYISNLINEPMLESIVMFFEVHSKTNEADIKSYIDIISKYTEVSPFLLIQGEVDRKWYNLIKEVTGAKIFNEIRKRRYNDRSSKLFDALNGKITKKDALKAINDKRNKEMLLAYSLIKPSKNKEKDLLDRIKVYRKFLKESKQFGSQRKATEKTLTMSAINNLSQTFGFGSKTLFKLYTFDLEMQQYEQYLNGIQIEDYFVTLVFKDDKFTINYERDGKNLKSKPAKIKKKTETVEEVKKELSTSFKELKDTFEKLMVDQVLITAQEFEKYTNNFVLSSFLSNVIYEDQEGNFLLYKDYKFVDEKLKEVDASKVQKVVIAHPTSIIKAKKYFIWKELLLDNLIVQPFRQLFRETYFKQQEEMEDTKTYRYSGHLVNMKTALTLLQEVDWKVSYDSIYKLYGNSNIRAEIWVYNPYYYGDEKENNFEEIRFINILNNKPVAIKEIPDEVFSEIMRDFDLAVSVAYVGEENKQLGLTTVDIRKSILDVNIKLFKMENVQVDKHKVKISGLYGKYIVNLKSGDVYKEGSGQLLLFPISVRRNKDVYLPFIDKNGKTQEIMSLVLLLSRDNKVTKESIVHELTK